MLSNQSKVLAIAAIGVYISGLIYAVRQRVLASVVIMWSMVYLLVVAALIYDTDCLIRGRCTQWSWARTTVYSIVPIAVILLHFHTQHEREELEKERVVKAQALLVQGSRT